MRKVTLAIAMLPLLASAPVFAAGMSAIEANPISQSMQTAFANELLSGWNTNHNAPTDQGMVQLAQASDPRVGQLQEELRQMSGKLEELNFQILQLQDQLRKTQEDNEFRFQELEKSKRSDAGSKSDNQVANARAKDLDEASQDASSGAASVAIGTDTAQHAPVRGEPPQVLGSIRFDANGNVIGEEIANVPHLNDGIGETSNSAPMVASLPSDDNPNSLYQAAYQYLMSGDYNSAETGFREHVDRYPADPMTAEARFWLGESLYGQGRYSDAANVFLDTQRDYPDSKRAPENMFKLGVTLEKLDNRDVACATFRQIPQLYPKAAPVILKRVTEERQRIKC